MKKLLMTIAVIFLLLTFYGAYQVLRSGGQMNAGYAVVPMALSIAALNGYSALRRNAPKE